MWTRHGDESGTLGGRDGKSCDDERFYHLNIVDNNIYIYIYMNKLHSCIVAYVIVNRYKLMYIYILMKMFLSRIICVSICLLYISAMYNLHKCSCII